MRFKALVLDLDNTLYDWLDTYVEGLRKQIGYLRTQTGVKEEQLLKAYRKVFKEYGSVEVPDASEKLTIWETCKSLNLNYKAIQRECQDILLENWRLGLHVYPDVLKVLDFCNQHSILVFGFTDAFSFWADYRLKCLRLEKYFERVYALENDLIAGAEIVRGAKKNENIISFSKEFTKPNTKVIEMIAEDYKLRHEQICMIGDSIDKDIRTARLAGVYDVWAQYGTRHQRNNSSIMSLITPWKKKKLQDNKEALIPTATINTFGQLLMILKD